MRYVCLTEPGDWQIDIISGKMGKIKDMRSICLSEPGDWKIDVISDICAEEEEIIDFRKTITT
jgi:hypothetical protein